MLKKIIIILVVVLAVLAFLINRQPAQFHVSRSTVINAPAASVFAQINSQRNWNSWSPWAKLDPNATFTYSGPESGVGAIAHWSGNSKVGEGTSTITDSQPDKAVSFKLEFVKPMVATNTALFLLEPQGGQTQVTWSMDGTSNFIGKAFNFFFDCEKMVGKQFEEGLGNLKALVESTQHAPVTAPVETSPTTVSATAPAA